MLENEMSLQLRYYAYAVYASIRGPPPGKVAPGAKIRISKTLSQILRHKAVDLNIPIRNDGYARVVDVLRCPWMTKLHVTLELLQEIVAGNDKKRFTLNQEDGEWHIRANQGHSIPIDDLALLTKLDAATLPADLECITEPFLNTGRVYRRRDY